MPGLDGLRAISVVAVVWHHSHPGHPDWPITHNGFLGVDVFFVLSGYLITTLLMSEHAQTGHISLTNFYIRRALRIFPLYYAVLALLALYFLARPAASQSALFLRELPFHSAYLSNWVPLDTLMAITWSLSTEEQFYLVWPPVLVLLGQRAIWVLLAFLLVNQAVNFGHLHEALRAWGASYDALPILQITFTPIVLGVLAAFALGSDSVRRFLARWPHWSLPILMVVALLVANAPGDLRGFPRLAFHLCVTMVVALVVVQPNAFVVRGLEWRPLAQVGTISYGVYLLHKIALHVVQAAATSVDGVPPSVVFITCLGISIVLAGLSYRYFERPILALKSRFR